jgi:hypothetical protein
MGIRPLVLCVVLLGAALGAAGCSSSGTSAPGASSSGAPVGKPTGTVTVKSGNKVVCVITLNQNGTGTCKITADSAPGSYPLVGTYNGGTKFKTGTAVTTLTVVPAPKKS